MDHSKFTSTGSGSPYAFGVLEDQYRDNMTLKEGLSIVKRALLSAMARDINSGDAVTLATITKDQGFRLLSKEDVEAIV